MPQLGRARSPNGLFHPPIFVETSGRFGETSLPGLPAPPKTEALQSYCDGCEVASISPDGSNVSRSARMLTSGFCSRAQTSLCLMIFQFLNSTPADNNRTVIT